MLAKRYHITLATVYKWRSRTEFHDRPHTAHRLQTTLTPAQEAIVVSLRKTLLLPLDDLLAVTREFLCPKVSRAGLDRCLRRHGVGNLKALLPPAEKTPHKAFKAYEPGYLHMDVTRRATKLTRRATKLNYLPQMQDETSHRYLFVAIDRATRWVFIALKPNKSAASARAFLKALHKACPIQITRLLTDNGKDKVAGSDFGPPRGSRRDEPQGGGEPFTDRLFGSKERQPTGEHEFDQLCQALGIEHRLTRPRTPKTNGMVERFNGRISDLLKTHRFDSALDLEQTLHRYVTLYNQHLPQSALASKTPMQAMKDWYQSHPHLFHRKPYNRPGLDT